MIKPRLAILDGDILAYRAAFWADCEGPEWLGSRLVEDVKRWTPPDVDEIVVELSCRREHNFRRDHYPEYKAHRNERPTPDTLPAALEFIRDNYPTLSVPRLEADDLIGIEQSGGRAIGVTIDKDLKQVPGWSWRPSVGDQREQGDPIFTTVEEGDRLFFKQWLTGDATDNIAGVWRMGPAKAEKVLNATLPQNWEAAVLAVYETSRDKNGSPYTLDFALSMATCVRILRDGEDAGSWKLRIWG